MCHFCQKWNKNQKDCVLLHQPKTRNLLLKYSGITSDRKKIRNPKSLTQIEFSSLKASISKEGFQALADLLARLNSCRTRTCPEAYRVFLSEIARNSPACGLLQLGCGRVADETQEVLEQISRNALDIQDSTNSKQPVSPP